MLLTSPAWWQAYGEWTATAPLPVPAAVYFEALGMQFSATATAIGQALLPAVERTRMALEAFFEQHGATLADAYTHTMVPDD